MGDFNAAVSAFERGLKLDPTNTGLKSGLQNAQARIELDTFSSSTSEPIPPSTRVDVGAGTGGLGGVADLLRGMAGGGGGMPDIASMMNNPQLVAMAQQMAANGQLANLMQNPLVANMVRDLVAALFVC